MTPLLRYAGLAALVLLVFAPATALAQPAPTGKPTPATKAPEPPADKPAAEPSAVPSPEATYSAYQRGYFLTALNNATKRAETGDAKAMTLLGEMYARGQGVSRDDAKAAEWYKFAADRGDREALYALGTFRLDGRAGPRDRNEAMRLFAEAAKLGQPSAAYNLGLANLEPQGNLKLAIDYLTMASKAGLSDAQYALALMYREGHGVKKDVGEAMRLMQQAAIADYPDAMVEFAIAEFNGTGTAKNEANAIALLTRAARMGNPVAQNRLAHIYVMGRGIKSDPVQAVKWHLAARAGGVSDPALDEYAARQTPQVRGEAEKAAAVWIEYYKNRPRT